MRLFSRHRQRAEQRGIGHVRRMAKRNGSSKRLSPATRCHHSPNWAIWNYSLAHEAHGSALFRLRTGLQYLRGRSNMSWRHWVLCCRLTGAVLLVIRFSHLRCNSSGCCLIPAKQIQVLEQK